MSRQRHVFQLNADHLLLYVAQHGKVTRAQTLADNQLYTRGQTTYGLDKLRKQGKVRRHRGKGGAFVYTFKHY